jgi:hypothetical protein
MPDSPNPGFLQVSPEELARSSDEAKLLASKARDIPEAVSIWVGPLLDRVAADEYGKAFSEKVLGPLKGGQAALESAAGVLEGTGKGGQTSASLFAQADQLGTESAVNLGKVIGPPR